MGKRNRANRRQPKDPFPERKAAALKQLKDYQSHGRFSAFRPEVIDILMDESDRGALLLVSGILEDTLADAIVSKLPCGADRADDLLRQGGTLNSFQSKMSFGRAIGVLDEDTHEAVDIIRLLRNACAHSIRPVTLHTPEIRDMFCLLLHDDVAKFITEDTNPDYVRFLLGLVMVFQVERLRGKTPEEAQIVVDKLHTNLQTYVRRARAKLEASREKQPEQHLQDDPPDQKG